MEDNDLPLMGAKPFADILGCTVISVHDGDTLRVRLPEMTVALRCAGVEATATVQLPEMFREWYVRLAGLDAPEVSDPRPEIRAIAANATLRLAALCKGRVDLRGPKHDKYGSRILARVEVNSGVDVGSVLLSEGLAKQWSGAGAKPW